MRKDTEYYIPCLRWKQGEYQALMRLSSVARNSIFPLIDVAEIGFDFETKTDSRSIDEHLSQFAKRVKKKWGRNECYVDLHHIEPSERMATGKHPITFVFDDLRANDVQAIPVIAISQDTEWHTAINQVIKMDGRGLCLRITLEEAANPRLHIKFKDLLKKSHIEAEQCDLLIDEQAPNFEPLGGFVSLLEVIIKNLPFLKQWRSFGLIGTSLPQSLSVLGSGTSLIPRNEWKVYKQLVSRLKISGIRSPSFGDYAINHPEVLTIDPRFMTTTANIRYTISDSWFIVRGRGIKKFGLGQHKDLCNLVVKSNNFCGQNYSKGDEYIMACANGNASTGNLTTWRWVGTNHHLEMVTRDVAKFVAS